MPYPLVSATIFSSSLNNHDSVDHQKRLDYLKSPWKGLWHYHEKRHLDRLALNSVMTLFQTRYQFKCATSFKKVWTEIGAKAWTPSTPLTAGILRTIDQAFQTKLIYHGSGMEAPLRGDQTTDHSIQNLMHTLMHGGQFCKATLLCQKSMQAVLFEQNSALMKDFRIELQRELNQLAKNPPETPQEEIMWKAFLGNLIAFLPFSYPPHGTETITIPLLKDGVCKSVEYAIHVMPLTLSTLFTPMSAVGLTPKNPEDKAPPLLTFLGTTYPAGDGCAATLLADFTPGYSVGEFVYDRNRQAIDQWMAGKTGVQLVGMSLGGAMAFHTLNHHHAQISRIDVYNPPGLYSWKHTHTKSCEINIYCQPGDIVSHLGFWPEGENVKLYTVMQHQHGLSENFLSAHARAFTGCETVTIIKQDPAKENRSLFRKALTYLHQFLGPFLVFIPMALALSFYYLYACVSRRVSRCYKNCSSG